MKLLHAADLHLGSPLRTALTRDPVRGAALAQALDGVLDRIVDIALTEAVDVVLLAGDIFDNGAPDVTLRARLLAQLRRLTKAGIPVAIIRGNHDALLDLTRYGPLGGGIHLLDRDSPTAVIGDAAIHGLGHRNGDMPQSLLPHYPAPQTGRLNIGLMHTSLDGTAGHDPYAPCATGDLLGHGYDYWALGHIHRRSETIQDGCAVVMPGIPQGRHINEDRGGGVTIATLGGTPSLRQVPVARLAFGRVQVDLTGEDATGILDTIAAALPDPSDLHHILRLHITGSALPEAELLALAREAASTRDGIGIEAVRRRAGVGAETAGLLTGLMREEAATDSFRDTGLQMMADLRDALPVEIRDTLSDAEFDALLGDGLSTVDQALRRGAP